MQVAEVTDLIAKLGDSSVEARDAECCRTKFDPSHTCPVCQRHAQHAYGFFSSIIRRASVLIVLRDNSALHTSLVSCSAAEVKIETAATAALGWKKRL